MGWGEVSLEGQSVDLLSGISKVEISFDEGKTWVLIGRSSPWSYGWKTAELKVPDGPHPILARAMDNACNQEHTARVVVNVDNTPPDITLKDSINILGRSTTVITFDAGSGVDHGLLTISGNGIEPRQITFTANQTQVVWDGLTGSGKAAPFGIFSVTVDVWDKVGNHSSTKGTWVRPRPVQPTAVPTEHIVQPVVTPIGPIPPVNPEIGPVRILGVPYWALLLPFLVCAGWLFVNGGSFCFDRRWSEVRKLQQELISHRKSISSIEEGEIHD